MRLLMTYTLAIAGVLCAPLFAMADEEPLRLVTGNEYAPFSEASLPHGGIFTQIVASSLKNAGHAFRIEHVPWSRGLDHTVKVKYDATFPYLYSDDRASLTLATDPVVSLVGTLVTNAKDPKTYTALTDVIGQDTCLPLGYENDGPFEEMEKQGQIGIQNTRSPEHCYFMLEKQRIGFIWDIQAIGTYLIQSNGMVVSDFTFTPFYDELKTDLRILVSREHPHAADLITLFNESIQSYKQTPAYQELDALYNLEGKPSDSKS